MATRRQIALVFPDGFGVYRIRTTSHHTVENLKAALKGIQRLSGGHFAGVPFDLRLTNRQSVGPDGVKRNYPVFVFNMNPPGGEYRLTSGTVAKALASGRKAASDLQLPPIGGLTPEDDAAFAFVTDSEGEAPAAPVTIETPGELRDEAAAAENEQFEKDRRTVEVHDPEADEITDAVFVDLTPEQLKDLEQNKDRDAMKRTWFAAVKGSHLDSNEGRADFLARNVDGVTSLREVVDVLSAANFKQLLQNAQEEIAEHNKEAAAALSLANPQGLHPSITKTDLREFVDCVRHLGLDRLKLYPFISMLIGRHVSTRSELEAQDVRLVLSATGVRNSAGEWAYAEAKGVDHLMKFKDWEISEEGVAGVI